jgi:hypothetical protein
VWEVNVEEDYHEEKAETVPPATRSGSHGTGRDAPVIPRASVERSRAERGVEG